MPVMTLHITMPLCYSTWLYIRLLWVYLTFSLPWLIFTLLHSNMTLIHSISLHFSVPWLNVTLPDCTSLLNDSTSLHLTAHLSTIVEPFYKKSPKVDVPEVIESSLQKYFQSNLERKSMARVDGPSARHPHPPLPLSRWCNSRLHGKGFSFQDW